jgi:hypothetical protein
MPPEVFAEVTALVVGNPLEFCPGIVVPQPVEFVGADGRRRQGHQENCRNHPIHWIFLEFPPQMRLSIASF